MSIKKLLWLMGLCVFFAGCSTGRYGNEAIPPSNEAKTTSTQMGVRYLLGRGVPQDNQQAFNYFNQGAREDDPFAQNELAYLYAAGKGTTRDYTKALKWYREAANHGLASAQYNLGLLYLYGLGTPVNRVQAQEWFKKSAAHGFEPARLQLAEQS